MTITKMSKKQQICSSPHEETTRPSRLFVHTDNSQSILFLVVLQLR